MSHLVAASRNPQGSKGSTTEDAFAETHIGLTNCGNNFMRSFLAAVSLAVFLPLPLLWANEPELKLTGRGGEKATFTVADLKALPRSEFEVKDRDGTIARFSGVEVSQLLGKIGTAQGEKLRGDWLRSFVAVDAADGYRAVFALPEFDAAFTDRRIYLVDSRNGQPLDATHGPFQIVVPDEKRHSRWVRMVTEIHVLNSN